MLSRNTHLLLCSLIFILCISCSKETLDPGGETADLSAILPGNWFVSHGGMITFKKDFTGVADSDLFDVQLNGESLKNFSWEPDDQNQTLLFSYGTVNRRFSTTRIINVKDSGRHRVVIDHYGIEVVLTR